MRRDLIALTAFVLFRAATDLGRLVAEPHRFDNGEERYNATVGWYVAHAGLVDQLLAVQYKSFCGGCSVLSLGAAASLGVFGDQVWAWKGLALLWNAAIHVLGFVALDRRVNRAAAWSFALLYALPPSGLADLQLMLWGNHAEGALFVVAALALRPGFAQGLVIGLGLWFSRTTAHTLVLLIPALHTHAWGTLVGLAVGAAPALVPAAAGDVGTYDLSWRANLLPGGLGWAKERFDYLVEARTIGPRLLPMVTGAAPWTWTWLAAGLVSVGVLVWRRSVIVALAVGFALLWSVTGFAIPRALPHAALLQHRYFAPWLFLGVLLGAAAAGHLPRLPRVALLAALLAAPAWGLRDVVGRAQVDSAVFTQPVIDHTWFAGIVYRRLPLDRVQAAHSTHSATERALRRLEGYIAADIALEDPSIRARLEGEAVSAWWQARTDPKDGWRQIASLNEAIAADADPLRAGRGAAANLAWDAPRGADLHARLREGLPEGAPCTLCSVIGIRAAWDCPDRACVAAAITGPEADEIAFGVGVALPAGTHPDLPDAVAAGTTSILHGMKAPFFPHRAPKAGRPGVMPKRPD